MTPPPPNQKPPRGLVLRLVGLLLLAVSVVAVPLGLGARVPKRHHARVEVHLASPPEAVFRKLADLEDWPRWNPYIGPMQRIGAGRYRTRPDPRSKLDYVLVESHPNDRVVVRLDGTSRGLDVRWAFELAEDDGGTRLAIVEDGRLESPTARFVMHYVTGYEAAALGIVRALERDEAPR